MGQSELGLGAVEESARREIHRPEQAARERQNDLVRPGASPSIFVYSFPRTPSWVM
jgi:hypothetical protein